MGFFSWKTQDTNKSIPNKYSGMKMETIYMVNPVTMETFEEHDYEGYGVFGGKDFYELVAELNGKTTRSEGIDIAFHAGNYVSPILVSQPNRAKEFIGQKPEICKYQGYFYPEFEDVE